MATKSEAADLGPVEIPAGSYDAAKLGEGLTAAAKAKPEDQAELVEKAIADAQQGDRTETRDPALIPGHSFMDVQTAHGSERRQVYVPPKEPTKEVEAVDPEKAEADREKANVAAVKAQASEAQKAGEVAPEEQAAAPEVPPAAGAAAKPAGASETK